MPQREQAKIFSHRIDAAPNLPVKVVIAAKPVPQSLSKPGPTAACKKSQSGAGRGGEAREQYGGEIRKLTPIALQVMSGSLEGKCCGLIGDSVATRWQTRRFPPVPARISHLAAYRTLGRWQFERLRHGCGQAKTSSLVTPPPPLLPGSRLTGIRDRPRILHPTYILHGAHASASTPSDPAAARSDLLQAQRRVIDASTPKKRDAGYTLSLEASERRVKVSLALRFDPRQQLPC